MIQNIERRKLLLTLCLYYNRKVRQETREKDTQNKQKTKGRFGGIMYCHGLLYLLLYKKAIYKTILQNETIFIMIFSFERRMEHGNY